MVAALRGHCQNGWEGGNGRRRQCQAVGETAGGFPAASSPKGLTTVSLEKRTARAHDPLLWSSAFRAADVDIWSARAAKTIRNSYHIGAVTMDWKRPNRRTALGRTWWPPLREGSPPRRTANALGKLKPQRLARLRLPRRGTGARRGNSVLDPDSDRMEACRAQAWVFGGTCLKGDSAAEADRQTERRRRLLSMG